jgi:pentatricopeptide repeat protein
MHRMMLEGVSCRPDLVSYNTVIVGFFKEREVGQAYSLFQEMLDHGISPDVVTYSSIIDVFKTQQWTRLRPLYRKCLRKVLGLTASHITV